MGQIATVCKIFRFEASHQLVGHKGQCANTHGHSYILEVKMKGLVNKEAGTSDEGFVMDFSDMKKVVNELIVDKMDHSFMYKGDEPILPALIETGQKVFRLGFRSTCENMAAFIVHELRSAGLPIDSVKLWETATGWAEVFASDVPATGPIYNVYGGCDCND